jgi:hypothetical protein
LCGVGFRAGRWRAPVVAAVPRAIRNLQLAHSDCDQSKGDFVELRELIPYLESRYTNF